MQPLPVPRSSTRVQNGTSSASSTSSSVSGRGSSTSGVTLKSRPQNARRPMIFATGSRAARRATSAKNRVGVADRLGQHQRHPAGVDRQRMGQQPAGIARRVLDAGLAQPADRLGQRRAADHASISASRVA